MKSRVCLTGLMIMVLSLGTSCALHTYHFGVQNRAATVPDDFGQTEAVLARAEQSTGAQYCPEKMAQARELARQGAEVYWACQNTESSRLLAEARKLAEEAERCGPQGAAAPPVTAAPKPACNLSVSPASIKQGESAELNWTSRNATECDIQPGIGAVKPQGTIEIKPSADTTYNLVCTGAGGYATKSAAVMVAAPGAPAREELCMKLSVEFATAKAIIIPAYYGEIEKVADFMKTYPQIKGTIEGHTDNVGSADYNQKLSQRRAESVVKMLVEKYGIDESRLAARGYGLTRPVATNKTAEGRQKNRRTIANFGCVTVEK
jgi:outer membrane protein OmpA-like peptidoglycan-associated protein